MTMSQDRCPDCGAQLPAHAPGGHCPRCLLLQGLDSDPPGTATVAPDRTVTRTPVASESSDDTIDHTPQSGSVLDTLSATGVPVPHVSLRETGVGEELPPLVRPATATDTSIRYRIAGEIARGGMGAVLKGLDPDLNREVAIKVLHEQLHDNGDMVRRFVEEAQIGGQLQHPGIVPIYELGTYADKRPFFSMKLVKGRTLADLLTARQAPSDDLPRFLSIFAAIAQTMAYAHTRGVIHRDLKPSNMMVGSFGEVQVMDWGLAKVLSRGGAGDARARAMPTHETPIATARSEADTGHSLAGSVMGTPSYMAPCQARGETDRIDERVDVFALGSILCEVLTGSPAFTGRGVTEVLKKAADGDTADALTRLARCGAEAELISLARDCLEVEPEDRPRDANVVSERTTAYLAGVQERVQAAERERAVAVARAIEERRRRRVQLALAASVLAFTTLGGLSTTYYLQQQAARAAADQRVIDRVTTLLGQALEQPEDPQRWEVALAAAQQADPAGNPKAMEQLVPLRKEIEDGLNAAKNDQKLLDRLVEIRSAEADDQNGSATEIAYADAFREAGIDLATLPPAEAGEKIKSRPPRVALAMASALDDWAAVRQGKQADPESAAKLRVVACLADPDPWRIDLRSALDQADRAARLTALQTLEDSAKFDELGPVSLNLLGSGLSGAGDNARAEKVLRKAQQSFPRDLWLNYGLAKVLQRVSQHEEAIRFFTAARSISPESAHELAHLLEHQGKADESIAVFRDLRRLRPGNARNLACMHSALRRYGHFDEAEGMLNDALAASRDDVRRFPDDALAHCNLGGLLRGQQKYDEAIAEAREALRLRPNLAIAHNILGDSLRCVGRYDEAARELEEAIRLDPGDAHAHSSLSLTFQAAGKLGDPQRASENFDRAVREARDATRLDPGDPEPHYQLGNSYLFLGQADEAAAAFREALRLRPDYAEAHCNLGMVLQARGDYAEAVEALRKGHELGSKRPDWRYPSERCLADAESDLAQANRVMPVLRGEIEPADNDERIKFAQMAYRTKQYVGAMRLLARAMENDPGLADDREGRHRYNAARCAVLAAAGRGKDDPPPDDEEKAKLLRQALGWLKEELALWGRVIESGLTEARPTIVKTLASWKQDANLVSVRDTEALANLPEAERQEWRTLWAEVEALLNDANAVKAEGDRPAPAAATNAKEDARPDDTAALAVIHKRAHELVATKPDEAEPLFRQALEGYRKAQGPDGPLTLDLTNDLASLFTLSGRFADAEPFLKALVEGVRKRFGPEDPRMAGSLATLGMGLIQQRKWAEAEPVLRECLTLREKLQPEEWSTFNTRSMLGAALLGQKKYDEAEPPLVSGYEGMKAREAKVPPQGKPRLAEAAERVIKLYEEWGKPEKAAEWRAKLAKPAEGPKPQP